MIFSDFLHVVANLGIYAVNCCRGWQRVHVLNINAIISYCSPFYNQNTKEKFDADPEDCDQKEMYKLLVCLNLQDKNIQ